MNRRNQTFLVAIGTALMMTGCATITPPLPPSLDLPKPPADLRAARKGERVVLTWTIPTLTTDRQTARRFAATRICRALGADLNQCATPVGETAVPDSSSGNTGGKKPTASYTDVLPSSLESEDPSRFATYAVEVRNADGRSAGLSNQVRVPLVRTLSPPQNFQARVGKEGVTLSWTNDIPPAETQQRLRYGYRIYRWLDAQSLLVAESPASTEHEMAFTDSNIEWEKTYKYRVETVTVIAGKTREEQVEGDDSPEIKVFVHDVFPPAVPSGLQAVFSGPGQKPFIDLIWAPVPDVDLDGYNVYRHEAGTVPVKVNSELVKTPAYRDTDVVSGKRYFYSVSALDVRGNESARSEEAAESVP